MRCRHCGTEIAEKALICYRCGAGTTEPRYGPPAVRHRRSRLAVVIAVLVVLLLVLLVFFLLHSSAL